MNFLHYGIILFSVLWGGWGFYELYNHWDAAFNNVGDFLAGWFSPMAFLWFVYAVFLQKKELEETRKEMRAMVQVSQKESAKQKLKDLEEMYQPMLTGLINLVDTSSKDIKESTIISLLNIKYKNREIIIPAIRPSSKEHLETAENIKCSIQELLVGIKSIFNAIEDEYNNKIAKLVLSESPLHKLTIELEGIIIVIDSYNDIWKQTREQKH